MISKFWIRIADNLNCAASVVVVYTI